MALHHVLLVAGGAACASVVAVLTSNGVLHKAAVLATNSVMAAGEAIGAETQSIVDDANDMRAEARRQAKIDAAVAEELERLEADIRKRVEDELDAKEAGR